jgi:hypothetical protein
MAIESNRDIQKPVGSNVVVEVVERLQLCLLSAESSLACSS